MSLLTDIFFKILEAWIIAQVINLFKILKTFFDLLSLWFVLLKGKKTNYIKHYIIKTEQRWKNSQIKFDPVAEMLISFSCYSSSNSCWGSRPVSLVGLLSIRIFSFTNQTWTHHSRSSSFFIIYRLFFLFFLHAANSDVTWAQQRFYQQYLTLNSDFSKKEPTLGQNKNDALLDVLVFSRTTMYFLCF